MRRILIALAVLVAAGSAAASEKDDVVAPVRQFIDGFNKGDEKTALAACASPAFIVDEFPPYAWQGAAACADWARDFDANAKQNVQVTGDRAYVVVPANYDYKQKGKKMSQKGSTFTAALQKGPAGWRITAWTWSTR
jgi:hypothetical protein